MVLDKDFREFIEKLNDNTVRYLVVGGYAVGFHGHPRYTKDLDVWIEIDPSNATKMIQALTEFGFGSVGLTVDDFLTEGEFTQLGYPPARIDIITSCEGVTFAECYAAREVFDVDGLSVNVIDLGNLKKNKAAVARPQDLADISNLKTS